MPTTKTFLLPDLGEGLTEADLVSWTVEMGDVVQLNQIIAEVETAKASVELPSPYAGTVVALHANPGDTVEVGKPFIEVRVETDDDAVLADTALAPEKPAPEKPAAASGGQPADDGASAPARTPVLVGYGVAADPTSRRRGARSMRTGVGTTTPVVVAAQPEPERPLASPPVRFAARRSNVDLTEVTATGNRGEVTRADLDAHLRTPPVDSVVDIDEVEEVPAPDVRDEIRTPIKGVRKHTAAAMVQSAFTAPHVTEFIDVDVTPMVDLLAKLKAHPQMAEVRITPLALVAKALLVALRTNPSLNSSWDEGAQEIVTKRYVNLGIAAATPRGLMVPNIKNAHLLSLRELAVALTALTATAKAGKTGPADLATGTITITNVGVFGIDAGTPILNPGEAAILCFGSIRKRPWEHNGDIVLRSITTLSLSFDHRLADGEQGSRFLATIASILSDPLASVALS